MGAQFTHPWATSTDPIAVRIATMSMRCDGMDRKLQGSTIARFKSHIMGKNPIVVCPSLKIFSNRRSKPSIRDQPWIFLIYISRNCNSEFYALVSNQAIITSIAQQ